MIPYGASKPNIHFLTFQIYWKAQIMAAAQFSLERWEADL